MTLLWHC